MPLAGVHSPSIGLRDTHVVQPVTQNCLQRLALSGETQAPHILNDLQQALSRSQTPVHMLWCKTQWTCMLWCKMASSSCPSAIRCGHLNVLQEQKLGRVDTLAANCLGLQYINSNAEQMDLQSV